MLIVTQELGLQGALAVLLDGRLHVDSASTSSEVLDRLVSRAPDIVVMDVTLTDVNAPTLLQRLRARYPGCPVIAVAAKEALGPIHEMATIGLQGLLWKPLDVDALLGRINSLLKQNGTPDLCCRFGPHVSRAVGYLAAHYREPLTIQTIASASGVSASHLAHLFPEETGATIRRFLVRLRVEVAKRLLTQQNEKLDSLAEAIGFCDASHFSRAFERHTGHRPGEYRRLTTRNPGFQADDPAAHIFFPKRYTRIAIRSSKSANAPIVAPRRWSV